MTAHALTRAGAAALSIGPLDHNEVYALARDVLCGPPSHAVLRSPRGPRRLSRADRAAAGRSAERLVAMNNGSVRLAGQALHHVLREMHVRSSHVDRWGRGKGRADALGAGCGRDRRPRGHQPPGGCPASPLAPHRQLAPASRVRKARHPLAHRVGDHLRRRCRRKQLRRPSATRPDPPPHTGAASQPRSDQRFAGPSRRPLRG